ncbi:MAG: SAM-dependent methyltransferase [Bacteroidetes bacterium]|nr:SAM-dependent methyltransferase [Bacteroidota bacterium]
MNIELNEEFWTERYKNHETGWNIGYASTPLVKYFDTLEDRSIKILIPGAGNAYEAEYLFSKGFKNVTVVDISILPLQNLSERFPEFPKDQLIHQNFFDHYDQYDLIVEQTFFCAIDPELRQAYANKMLDLLKDNGKIIGVWFDFEADPEKSGPPFTGTAEEYETYFNSFKSVKFQRCYNSVPPRSGRELFGIIKK